jgi:hypothetical protein
MTHATNTTGNFFLAVAIVARFHWNCRTHGWARPGRWDHRPAYAGHLYAATRDIGMSDAARQTFVRVWALDLGGCEAQS